MKRGAGQSKALGHATEVRTERWLVRHGLKPVSRNYSCRGGEIDLIMLDDRCLAFIEVRYRSSNRFTDPLLTVDRHKQRKLVRTAMLFTARHRFYAHHVMRFDVVAIDENGIRWLRDAFRPDDV